MLVASAPACLRCAGGATGQVKSWSEGFTVKHARSKRPCMPSVCPLSALWCACNEPVEVKSGSEGFTVKLADGSLLRCAHNQSEGARLPDYAPQPAMVLKLEDGSDILLPLIVCKCARATEGTPGTEVPLKVHQAQKNH